MSNKKIFKTLVQWSLIQGRLSGISSADIR
jgi:hypothetical protein